MTDLRRGDLVITDDHYYGIVFDLPDSPEVDVFCSNGIRRYYDREQLTCLPLQTVGEASNQCHANFAEILRRE